MNIMFEHMTNPASLKSKDDPGVKEPRIFNVKDIPGIAAMICSNNEIQPSECNRVINIIS